MPLFLQRRKVVGAPSSATGSLIGEEEEEELQDVQTKLIVNEPGDAFEREADAVAQRVLDPGSDDRTEERAGGLHTEGAVVQRKCAACSSGGSCPKCVEEEGEEQEQVVQRKASPNGSRIRLSDEALRPPDSGSPLSEEIRARVEPTVGMNLSSVRVHSGPAAQETAARLNSRAFTHRNHIWLGPGERADDLRLVAHEATHVAQQTHDSALVTAASEGSSSPGGQNVSAVQRQTQDPREEDPSRSRRRPGQADAAGIPPPSPVLEAEIAEVTSDGSVTAKREPGRPTMLEPASGPPHPPASAAVLPAPNKSPAPGAPPAGEMSSPAPTSQDGTIGAIGGEGTGQEKLAEDGQRNAPGAGVPPESPGEELAPEALSEDEAGKPGVGAGDDAGPGAADSALMEGAMALIPGPNPAGVRDQIEEKAAPQPASAETGATAAGRERIQQLLQTLRAEAIRQKEAITARAEAGKEELQAEAAARIGGISARAESATAAAHESFAAARGALESESAARRAELTAVTEAEAARAESETAGRIAEAETQFTQRQTALTQDAETARLQPPLIAATEATRADGELERAASECEGAGDREAAKHSGSEESDADKRAAAREVARESAADIRAKKPAIREDLSTRASDFSGQYLEYAATVNQKISETREVLIPELRTRGEGAANSIRAAEGGAASALEQRLAADLAALSSAEEQAVAEIREAAGGAVAEIRRTATQAEQVLDAVAVSGHAAIDSRASEVDAAISGDPEAPADGSIAVIEEAIASVAQIGSATEEQLDNAIAAGAGELAARGTAFDSQAAQLQDEAGATAQRLQQEASAALGAAVETHQSHANETLAALAADQANLQTSVLAEVDSTLAEARTELARINDQFRDEARNAADAAIEEAIKPRTDDVETRAAEAASQVDDAWYEGLFRAIGQIIVGLIILAVVALIVAAIAFAFGVILTAWGAIMIAGALLLAAGFIWAIIQRSGQAAYQGQPGAIVGRAALDAIGFTGIQEAWTGREVGTGRALSAGERTERGVLGVVTLVSLVLGVRSAIKVGPRGLTRPPGARPVPEIVPEPDPVTGKIPKVTPPPNPKPVADVMQWGTGIEGIPQTRARIGTLTRGELEQGGISRQVAAQWRDLYINEAARNPYNPATGRGNAQAAPRADLMRRAVQLLEDVPPTPVPVVPNPPRSDDEDAGQ